MAVVLAASFSGRPALSDDVNRADQEPGQEEALNLSEAFRRAAEQALPSVVTIETLGGERTTIPWAVEKYRSEGRTESERDGWRPSDDAGGDGTASGVVIDRRGYILTCDHAVAAANAVFVRLADGRRYEAMEVRTDPLSDLAVIRITGAGELPAAKWGDSDKLQMGDWVVSVGNPYGLGQAVSAGIVSETERELTDSPYAPMIQSDAATNPGSSGGALINLQGEVVGICEGGYGVHGGFEGIGFAIPANIAKHVAQQLIAHGEVPRAYLGCESEVMTASVAEHLELPPAADGLIVCAVDPQSPAAAAGVVVGDVLLELDDMPIRTGYQLYRFLEDVTAKTSYTLEVYRDGARLVLVVQVEQLHSETQTENGKRCQVCNRTNSLSFLATFRWREPCSRLLIVSSRSFSRRTACN